MIDLAEVTHFCYEQLRETPSVTQSAAIFGKLNT